MPPLLHLRRPFDLFAEEVCSGVARINKEANMYDLRIQVRKPDLNFEVQVV